MWRHNLVEQIHRGSMLSHSIVGNFQSRTAPALARSLQAKGNMAWLVMLQVIGKAMIGICHSFAVNC
jgi:hypothetical protein